jgi:hypothetical protein
VELFECCVSHMDGPGFQMTKSIDAAMVPQGCPATLPKCGQSLTHATLCVLF